MLSNKVIIILNIAALIGTLIWLMIEKSWEPLVTSLGLIATLIALVNNNNNNSAGNKTTMSQKGGNNSKNYQSTGNITIRNDK